MLEGGLFMLVEIRAVGECRNKQIYITEPAEMRIGKVLVFSDVHFSLIVSYLRSLIFFRPSSINLPMSSYSILSRASLAVNHFIPFIHSCGTILLVSPCASTKK